MNKMLKIFLWGGGIFEGGEGEMKKKGKRGGTGGRRGHLVEKL